MKKRALGKREIVLAALVLGLGAAVYLNWQYADIGKDLAVSNTDISQSSQNQGKNYGDAKYVEGKVEDAMEEEVYFAEAKLNRTKSRDEAVSALKEALQNTELSADKKADLAEKAATFAKSIEVEGKIENLIKAKGFKDCMVYYDNDRVDVVIKTSGLLENETAQIWDIVAKETNISAENVSIIEVEK